MLKSAGRYGCNQSIVGRGHFAAFCLNVVITTIESAQMQELVDQLKFIPVFTAHPTEARRHTTMNILQSLFVYSDALNNLTEDSFSYEQAREQTAQTIDLLWSSDEVRTRKPVEVIVGHDKCLIKIRS